MPDEMKTALYCRSALASTEDIQRQSLRLEAYAREHGFVNTSIYIDNGCSGTTLDRPAFRQMLKDIASGKVTTVIVVSLSRISRNLHNLELVTKGFLSLFGTRLIAIEDNYDNEIGIGL
jgi:DNA invertase Pin-like site-specific DNA recombinase